MDPLLTLDIDLISYVENITLLLCKWTPNFLSPNSSSEYSSF